ncbi:MAG: hypothetical protein ACYCOU_02825 [Sulfobacillus sp.]
MEIITGPIPTGGHYCFGCGSEIKTDAFYSIRSHFDLEDSYDRRWDKICKRCATGDYFPYSLNISPCPITIHQAEMSRTHEETHEWEEYKKEILAITETEFRLAMEPSFDRHLINEVWYVNWTTCKRGKVIVCKMKVEKPPRFCCCCENAQPFPYYHSKKDLRYAYEEYVEEGDDGVNWTKGAQRIYSFDFDECVKIDVEHNPRLFGPMTRKFELNPQR